MSSTFLDDLLSEIVPPADGTLSRVLYRDERIRLVGFGFDAGQELTEHSSSFPAIVQLVSGRVSVSVEGQEHLMGPSSWLHMEPNAKHSLRADEPSVLLLTLIKGSSTP